jgi:hypothetical protein
MYTEAYRPSEVLTPQMPKRGEHCLPGGDDVIDNDGCPVNEQVQVGHGNPDIAVAVSLLGEDPVGRICSTGDLGYPLLTFRVRPNNESYAQKLVTLDQAAA